MSLIAQKLISASGATEETDDDFNLVTGLYHFDGSNGAQNNTLLDSSSESHTVTRNADIVQGTFSPFSADEGKWSISFDGTDDYLGIASSSDFALGSGDFTLEAFVFQNSEAGSGNTSHNIINKWNNTGNLKSYFLRITESSGQKLQFFWSTDGNSNNYITSNDSLNAGQWHHVAVVNNGGTLTLFIDGTAQSSTGTAGTLYTSSAQIQIGRTAADSGSQYFDGFISNVRIVKGTAIYTSSSYTVPTTPLTAVTNTKLLTCCSNRFRDKSTSAHTITTGNLPRIQPFSPFAPSASYSASSQGGSGFFDGTSDCWLTVADDTDFDFSTGDYTIEAWFYPTVNGSVFTLPFAIEGGNNYWGWTTYGSGYNGLTNHVDTLDSSSGSDSENPNKFGWNHLVYQVTSGTNNWYKNGVQVYSGTAATHANATGFRVGRSPSYNNHYYGGYISDVRIVKGSNVYSNASTLTVPTAPLTSVTNTKLLLNFTNAAAFDQTGKTNVSTVGNAQLDTSVKKFGTASLELDGTGDYIKAPEGTQLSPNNGPFTYECFVYPKGSGYGGIFDTRTNNPGADGIVVFHNGTSIEIYWGASNTSFTVTSAVTLNQWQHFALTRDSSNNVRAFVNGTQAGSTQTSNTNFNSNSGRLVIGAQQAFAYPLDGFIDEFRITFKARYTSNFTAPTKAFPNL